MIINICFRKLISPWGLSCNPSPSAEGDECLGICMVKMKVVYMM